MPRTHSRRFRKAEEQVDRARRYAAGEGISLIKNLPAPKFDESVEVAVRLGIDPKKTDQLVRGSVSLPKGTGIHVHTAAAPGRASTRCRQGMAACALAGGAGLGGNARTVSLRSGPGAMD